MCKLEEDVDRDKKAPSWRFRSGYTWGRKGLGGLTPIMENQLEKT